jgi:methanogenic corrinoid protein MtbC1
MGPLLEEVGARWHRGELGPAQEHLVSVAVRRVLGWLLDTYEPGAGAPVVVATTLEGEQHEFGAMLASAVAAEEGWRVVYLGPALPVAEIAAAVRALGAGAVALSAVYMPAPAKLVAEVSALRGHLSPGVVLMVGGRGVRGVAAELTAGGATTVEDLDDFRALLRAVRRTRQETRSA